MKLFKRIVGEAIWLAVAIAVVAGGWFGFQYLGQIRVPVEAAPVERPVPLVETETLLAYSEPLPIRGEGFVSAFRSIDVAAQTSGRIVEMDPAIESRGSFEAGVVLIKLDDRQARATLAQTEANIRSTEAQLALNATQLERTETLRARGIIAQDQLDQTLTTKTELEASLASLQATLESTRVSLEFTEIIAPFAGKVLDKSADIGTVVNPGQSIAQIYSDREMEVIVPVSEQEAALIPNLFDSDASQAKAIVSTTFAGNLIEWEATVDRVANGFDTQTRTLNVAVRLDDPTNGRVVSGDSILGSVPPALIDAFVNVEIEGIGRSDLFAVPSLAVRGGSLLWSVSDDQLNIIPITVAHVDGERTFVSGADLAAGIEIVSSTLPAVSDGMAVSVIETPQNLASAE